jgi:hypothetical protein
VTMKFLLLSEFTLMHDFSVQLQAREYVVHVRTCNTDSTNSCAYFYEFHVGMSWNKEDFTTRCFIRNRNHITHKNSFRTTLKGLQMIQASTLSPMCNFRKDTHKRPASTILSEELSHHHQHRRIIQNPRSRKRVRFNDPHKVQASSAPAPSTFTEEDAQGLWFQKDEIRTFQLEARDYILGLPLSETRGLERFDLDRVKNKELALKCTLKASRCGFDGEDLAAIAKECASSAMHQAFLTGCEDFCNVYRLLAEAVDLKSPSSDSEESLTNNLIGMYMQNQNPIE